MSSNSPTIRRQSGSRSGRWGSEYDDVAIDRADVGYRHLDVDLTQHRDLGGARKGGRVPDAHDPVGGGYHDRQATGQHGPDGNVGGDQPARAGPAQGAVGLEDPHVSVCALDQDERPRAGQPEGADRLDAARQRTPPRVALPGDPQAVTPPGTEAAVG